MAQITIEAPTKQPTVLQGVKGVLVILLGSLFLLEKPEAQGRLPHTVLCWLGVQECGQVESLLLPF